MNKFVKGLTDAVSAEGLGFLLGVFIVLTILAIVQWRPEDVAARIQGTDTSTG